MNKGISSLVSVAFLGVFTSLSLTLDVEAGYYATGIPMAYVVGNGGVPTVKSPLRSRNQWVATPYTEESRANNLFSIERQLLNNNKVKSIKERRDEMSYINGHIGDFLLRDYSALSKVILEVLARDGRAPRYWFRRYH
ncbi:hypothetical protein [Bartonella sp. F02]|uniref:hypothetical protein n=1 Tax=Bartonella sp. F02 TaxID=2967262 RepID=UPI0022A9DB3D|nr:hypothetical protein [Bartonella sp. F02]MCZ2328253.1 hypothetical protein [Bartonella sp. F02]